jgi:hypothetical protein
MPTTLSNQGGLYGAPDGHLALDHVAQIVVRDEDVALLLDAAQGPH